LKFDFPDLRRVLISSALLGTAPLTAYSVLIAFLLRFFKDKACALAEERLNFHKLDYKNFINKNIINYKNLVFSRTKNLINNFHDNTSEAGRLYFGRAYKPSEKFSLFRKA